MFIVFSNGFFIDCALILKWLSLSVVGNVVFVKVESLRNKSRLLLTVEEGEKINISKPTWSGQKRNCVILNPNDYGDVVEESTLLRRAAMGPPSIFFSSPPKVKRLFVNALPANRGANSHVSKLETCSLIHSPTRPLHQPQRKRPTT